MPVNQKTRVKICCIKSAEEAALAITAGADILGLVSAMPSGPGVIDDQQIAGIVSGVPAGISTFLLTSRTTAAEIVEQATRCRCSTLQLVDAVQTSVYDNIRRQLPAVKIVQVLHVSGRQSIEDARAIENQVDAILLDSGNPNAEIKELGGTGRIHNWQISAELVQTVKTPVFLAGGLRAENIVEAINTVRPFGVDLCSGVRSNDRLDAAKLNLFMQQVRGLEQR